MGDDEMYKIAICDDDVFQNTYLEQLIENFFINRGIKFELDIYQNGYSLIDAITKQKLIYQILFLDIEMAELNGIDTARKIRKYDKKMLLSYITSYDKYTIESFEVFPFRYLLKPVNEEKIDKLLDLAIEEININNNYLFFKSGSEEHQMIYDKIITISSERGRQIRVENTMGKDILFYGKIKELELKLDLLRFVKVNSGTIVNMNYIDYIADKVIYLTNGNRIILSRGQSKMFKECYNRFIERAIGI